MSLEVETVLSPVDGSEASATAAEYAIEVAERYDAGVHVLFVVGDDLARDIETGEVDAEADGRGPHAQLVNPGRVTHRLKTCTSGQ